MFDSSYTQTLQDQIGQLSKLLGVQSGNAAPQASDAASAASQYDLVTGLDGAKSFMSKMLAGTRHIVWDNEQPVFYVLQKDANGAPQRIKICTFTVELEPTMEEKYVSREDFNALVSKLDQLLQSKDAKTEPKTVKDVEEVKNNG